MFKRLLPVLLVLTALPAGATTTFYVGNAAEAAFNTAAGALTYFNFSGSGGLPATTFLELNTGINFGAFINSGATAANLTLSGSKLSQTSGFGGDASTILLDLPTTVTIIGMHISASVFGDYCYGAPNTTSCPVGNTFTVDSTPTFFGIISDAALSDFQLRRDLGGSSRVLQISDVAVSSGSAPSSEAPEPSTLALVGGGLLLFPFIARRKRRE